MSKVENTPFNNSGKSRRNIQFVVGKICHQGLFKKLARIVEHAETKDVRLQIVFCKSNFLRLISNQDSGLISFFRSSSDKILTNLFGTFIRSLYSKTFLYLLIKVRFLRVD